MKKQRPPVTPLDKRILAPGLLKKVSGGGGGNGGIGPGHPGSTTAAGSRKK